MHPRRLLNPLFLATCLVGLAACGGGKPDPKAAKAPPTLLVAAEDVITVGEADLAGSAPAIIGTIEPARRADVRAEVAAVVLEVLKDSGEPVRRGDLLLRIDDTALRDTMAASEETVRAAREALAQTQRQVERVRTLQGQGMVSMQAAEDAEVRRNAAKSELAAAEARAVAARQQVQRTQVRAPFDGVVSERRVSAGDTVQPGRELLKVIDPASLRFEGRVPADRVSGLALGQAVRFRVNGEPGVEYEGRIDRIDAVASAATRQVEVRVALDAARAPKRAGLYAEGRVAGAVSGSRLLPDAAVVRSADGSAASVWRLRDGKLEQAAVQLGPRDARSGGYPLLSGLAPGDRILRAPAASKLVAGQAVEEAKAPTAGKPQAAGG